MPSSHGLGSDFPILSSARTWNTFHSIQGLTIPMWRRVKDAASVHVKVPDSISLLSVCTMAMREWEPGTVSAQSHSNLDVQLWGLSLLLPAGFRASRTHTARDTHTHTLNSTYGVFSYVILLSHPVLPKREHRFCKFVKSVIQSL